MFKRLREEIAAIKARDPAAHSSLAIVFCYPGFHAIASYRLAHWMWRRGWQVPAIGLSYMARIVTGIEIHPGATIGRRFFIDHGTGVVVGETSEIGDDVMLYQGVTLGGTSLNQGKRHPTLRDGCRLPWFSEVHPTLRDGVIVGAGAKVLGPITVGENARVGANAVVLKDVEPAASMVGVPAQPLRRARGEAEAGRFVAYGTPCDSEPDPVACAILTLREEVARLSARIAELEGAAPRLSDATASRPAAIGLSETTIETTGEAVNCRPADVADNPVDRVAG